MNPLPLTGVKKIQNGFITRNEWLLYVLCSKIKKRERPSKEKGKEDNQDVSKMD